MFTNPDPKFLYSPYKMVTQFEDDVGTLKTGQGTAFVIALDSNGLAIVTNRHVIDLNYKELSPKYKAFKRTSVVLTGRRNDDSLYRFSIDLASEAHFSEEILNDVAVFVNPRVHEIENMIGTKLHYRFGIEELADENFFNLELTPFDVVAFSGFPEEHDRLAERPLIRGGRIASDPKFDFSIDGKLAGQCVAYEAFSHGGASGSPVYALTKGLQGQSGARTGRLVGINAGHLKRDMGQHTGLSYFYRSTVILKILKKVGAIDGAT